MFVGAVVVASDGACTDVDPFADIGVADVAQVIHLGTATDLRFLDLDKVADVRVTSQLGTRAKTGEWADLTAGADLCLFEDAVFVNFDVVTNADIAQHAIRTDPYALAELDVALEHDVDVDLDIGSVSDLAADIDALRIA